MPRSLLETKEKKFDLSTNSTNKYITGEKKCEFCKEVFETRLGLIQHIQESHAVESETNNREKRYTCNICNVFKAYYMSVIRKHKKGCENLMNGLNVNMQDNGQFKVFGFTGVRVNVIVNESQDLPSLPKIGTWQSCILYPPDRVHKSIF